MTQNSPDAMMPDASAMNPPDSKVPSLLALVNVVLRHRALIIGMSLAVGALWVARSLVTPRRYSSTTTFVPQARRSSSNLAGFAAQLGLSVASAEGSTSPQFYVDLVKTRSLLRKVVEAQYRFVDQRGQSVTGDLTRFYSLEEASPALRRESAIRRLRNDVFATSDVKTGVISVRVQAAEPEVAQQIATMVLQGVNEFNLRSRREQAAADRRFMEERVAAIQVELRVAEDRLERFLEVNRDTRAPKLVLQLDRLNRAISTQQQLYVALAQAYGQARVEELRDTPVVATVEAPEVPVIADPRGTLTKLILGLLLGAVLGIVLAFARNALLQSRQSAANDYQEFTNLRRAALDDFVHPWRPVRRALDRRSVGGIR